MNKMKLMAVVVAVLPAAVGLAGGVRLDISGEMARQTVIAEGGRTLPEGYQGHPTTVLTREGKLVCVWTLGHGGPCGPAAESTDGGRTWTRIDDRFPKVYRETHKNCPTLQKCVCRDGHERLLIFSAKYRDDPNVRTNYTRLGTMISDDGGKSWREGKVADLSSAMPPTGFMQLKDGSLALFGQVRLDRAVKTDGPKDDQGVWMSVSRDDGETWSSMRIVAWAVARNLCEPCCLRSPNGKTLALLMRENRHRDCSLVCFSTDEGRTWTKPILTAPELTGDRHEGIMLDDGRYLICFRDQMKNSPTAGQYVGWVGSWDDIAKARAGDLRIRLLNHHGKPGVWPGNEWDTGYSGVEKLADGTILCTTYTKHFDDDRHSSVVATRLYPSDFNNAMNSDADITAFGVRTDAAPAANAAAIQKAIDAAAAVPGGGRVVVPAGEWVSGTIWLKSNVELHLEKGAVLKASTNLADYNREDAYPENWGCPKSEYWRGFHFIICRCAENVSITGEGTIHGNGDVFFDEKPIRYLEWMTPTALCWWNGIRWSKDKVNLRPGQLVVFIKCGHLLVDGITIRNAPCWSMFFHGCRDVTVRNYTVRNGHDDGNTDGIDIDCCQNVLLEDLDIDTGDDAVTVRGSGKRLGLDPEPPCENVVVRRAKLKATSSVFRIGVGAGTIRNVTVEDVTSGRGGTAINLNACYGSKETGGVDMENIVFRRCRFDNCREAYNIHAAGKKQTFGIRNVIFEDVVFPPNVPRHIGADKGSPEPLNIKVGTADKGMLTIAERGAGRGRGLACGHGPQVRQRARGARREEVSRRDDRDARLHVHAHAPEDDPSAQERPHLPLHVGVRLPPPA